MGFFDSLDASTLEGRLTILNILYATEIVAAQQYWNHEVLFQGPYSLQVQEMLAEHADEEMGHASRLRDRIAHLGGRLNNSLIRMYELGRAVDAEHNDVATAEAEEGTKMLQQDEHGEDNAIAAYTEAIALFAGKDPVTAHMLTEILADEYEHRHDLVGLLSNVR